MNKRKRLPKAILWTADAMREVGADGAQRGDMQHPGDLSNVSIGRAGGDSKNVIEMMPMPETTSAPSSTPPKSTITDNDRARRRLQARAIVERHANFSAIGGIIPLPVLNIASITTIIVRMVKSLSRLYAVPFDRNRTRAVVIGLIGGIMPTGLATAAVSTLIYFVPGYNLLGLAVSSVTASAYARGIGHMFIEHFENGSTLVDFPSAVLR
jgi:uncharacterized protein (DUF697 family)